MNQTHIAARTKSVWLSDVAAIGSAQGLRSAMQARSEGADVARLKSLAIVGAGPEGQRLARLCTARDIRIDAVVDDDPVKHGVILGGQPVASVQSLTALPKSTAVIIASHRVLGVTRRLRDLGFKAVVPFAMLQVLAPDIFPPHMFYDNLLEDLSNHRSEYEALHNRL